MPNDSTRVGAEGESLGRARTHLKENIYRLHTRTEGPRHSVGRFQIGEQRLRPVGDRLVARAYRPARTHLQLISLGAPSLTVGGSATGAGVRPYFKSRGTTLERPHQAQA